MSGKKQKMASIESSAKAADAGSTLGPEDHGHHAATATATTTTASASVRVPTTMATSIMLSGARDGDDVLKEDIDAVDSGKINIRFKPLPSAPMLKTKVFKINASQKFEAVVRFLRKKLDCKSTDSVFCYVNSVFAPALDENVGGLWRCFKTDDQLIVCYSLTPAFG